MNKHWTSRRPIAVAMALASLAAPCAALPPTPQEQATAVSLALRLGMPEPLSVRKVWWGLPSGCEALLAESAPVVDGNKRSWWQLYLGRTVADASKACPGWPAGTEVLSEGGWTAARSQLTEMTTWRFAMGEDSVDIRLGADVSYAAAEAVLRALHRHSWQDERSAEHRRMFPGFSPSSAHLVSGISHITRNGRLPGGYDVWLKGLLLSFSVDGSRVSLHASSMVVV